MNSDWHVPSYVTAVRQALNFSEPRIDALARLSESEWEQAIPYCDRSHLTIELGRRCREHLPDHIAARFASNIANNAARLAKLERAYSEIAQSFECAGVEWMVLKGFSHWPGIGTATRYRPQYDIDLFCPPEHIGNAKDALHELRYQPLAGFDRVALDHVPTMVRPSDWTWREDFFDVEIPGSVDLHYRFWDAGTERIGVNGVEGFWDRREWSGRPDFQFPALSPPDLPGYAALHLLRHLLRGDVRPFHVYDIAWFLDSRSEDGELWSQWRDHHDATLQRLELVVFRLAEVWFGCRLPPIVQAGISELPGAVKRWFELYSGAPLEGQFHANKSELWLHLSLLNDARDRRAVFFRRILPAHLPPPAEAQVEASKLNPWRYWRKSTARGVYHLQALIPACLQGIAWWWTSKGFSAGFLAYWAAASLYNFGLFIFFLLYNLYLAQLGYKEDFIGLASGLTTAGALAGSLPAGALINRIGVKRALLACALLVPAACALRAVPGSSTFLLVTAFAGGFVSSLWAVIQAPAVAQLTRPDSRTLGFSLIFSSGISIGFLGGLVGGRLPHWLAANAGRVPSARDMRMALLAGCGLSMLALIPAFRLRLAERWDALQKSEVPLRSLWRFLVPAAIWNLAIGAVNPFFSLYFTKHWSMPVQEFGTLFGGAKVLSLISMLFAAAYFRRTSIAQGVARTQLAAAAALAFLAVSPVIWFALPAYLAFESFEWMAEPGCYGLMTNLVTPEQRTSASALYFLVASSAHVLSAALAGAAIARVGYLPVILFAACTALIAALAFQSLLRDRAPAAQALAHSRL